MSGFGEIRSFLVNSHNDHLHGSRYKLGSNIKCRGIRLDSLILNHSDVINHTYRMKVTFDPNSVGETDNPTEEYPATFTINGSFNSKTYRYEFVNKVREGLCDLMSLPYDGDTSIRMKTNIVTNEASFADLGAEYNTLAPPHDNEFSLEFGYDETKDSFVFQLVKLPIHHILPPRTDGANTRRGQTINKKYYLTFPHEALDFLGLSESTAEDGSFVYAIPNSSTPRHLVTKRTPEMEKSYFSVKSNDFNSVGLIASDGSQNTLGVVENIKNWGSPHTLYWRNPTGIFNRFYQDTIELKNSIDLSFTSGHEGTPIPDPLFTAIISFEY